MHQPLADSMRPRHLSEVVGQEHLTGERGLLSRLIAQKRPLSLLFWGPPGCGKTTLARLYAQAFDLTVRSLSAVMCGVKEIRQVIDEVKGNPLFNRGCVLFVDEIHRFNKSQQDAFLPYIEDGTLLLIGATTENPSFYLNDALLSRLQVVPCHSLQKEALKELLCRYEKSCGSLPIPQEGHELLIDYAQGDGRYLFNLVETLRSLSPSTSMTVQELEHLLQRRAALSDRKGDQHYQLISALHKSIRGSDPDAALYWLARMLKGGEDPLFLARRLLRMASEDIGLADPQALALCIAARDTYQMLGSPEGDLALAQAAVYLALSPKSNAIYKGFQEALSVAEKTSSLAPPKTIINAPHSLMKQLNYGKGYIYDHDTPDGFSGQNYFPEGMEPPSFYHPFERGFEREMSKRLDYFSRLRKRKQNP